MKDVGRKPILFLPSAIWVQRHTFCDDADSFIRHASIVLSGLVWHFTFALSSRGLWVDVYA